jgi:tripartite-type tricarboxylate transporter receptor subunit TctC
MRQMNFKMNSIHELNRRSFLNLNMGIASGLALSCMGTKAQTLKGNVKLIVPFTAGSGPDIVSRILSPKLGTLWDTSVIVENKPGASGTIGADLVAKSIPDGHTLMVGPASSITGPHLYAKLPFDIIKDLQPITNVGTTSLVLAVHKSFPVNSLQEFIAYVKARPGQLNYGSPGNGTHHHLCMELLKIQTGLNIVHIPYKGSAGAENDLIAGIIPAMFLPIHVALAKMRAGQIKVLGSSLKERHPLFKEIPSLHEQGVTGYDVDLWLGIWGPAGLPAPLLNKLNADIRTIVAQPETTEKLNAQGLIPNTSSPDQFSKLVKEDWERWGRVIKEAKITAD